MAKLDSRLTPPTKASDTNTWLVWMENLTSVVGKQDARTAFIRNWAKRGNENVANDGTFRKTMKDKYNIEITGTTFASSIVDFGDGIFDTVGGVFKMGAGVSMAMTIVSILLISFIVYRIAKPESLQYLKYAK